MKVAANIVNKHSRKADKGCPSGLGVRRVLRTPHCRKTKVSQNEYENSDYEIVKDEVGKECETFGEKWKRIQAFGGEF